MARLAMPLSTFLDLNIKDSTHGKVSYVTVHIPRYKYGLHTSELAISLFTFLDINIMDSTPGTVSYGTFHFPKNKYHGLHTWHS